MKSGTELSKNAAESSGVAGEFCCLSPFPVTYRFWATGRRNKCREDNSSTARRNGNSTIPVFASGVPGGRLWASTTLADVEVTVVCAMPELFIEEAPAKIKAAARPAGALRTLLRNLELVIFGYFDGQNTLNRLRFAVTVCYLIC